MLRGRKYILFLLGRVLKLYDKECGYTESWRNGNNNLIFY